MFLAHSPRVRTVTHLTLSEPYEPGDLLHSASCTPLTHTNPEDYAGIIRQELQAIDFQRRNILEGFKRDGEHPILLLAVSMKFWLPRGDVLLIEVGAQAHLDYLYSKRSHYDFLNR